MKIKGNGVSTDFSRIPGTRKALSGLSMLVITLTRMLALLIVGNVERTRGWRWEARDLVWVCLYTRLLASEKPLLSWALCSPVCNTGADLGISSGLVLCTPYIGQLANT